MTLLVEKQHAHELIDRLSEHQLSTAVRFLEFILLDPVVRVLAAAPRDDEELTSADQERLQKSLDGAAKHSSMDEFLQEFRVTAEDFPLSH